MREATCRSCRAKILWAVTINNKAIPLDDLPAPDGILHLEEGVAYVDLERERWPGPHYKSHFVTCPNAKQHRKAR